MKGKAAVVLVSLVVVIGAGALWWRTTAEVAPVSGAVPAPVRRLSGPLDRVRAAFDVSDRAARSARLEDVWRQLSPENAGQVADELWSRVQGSPFQNDWLEFLQRWAELDPAAAAQFIASHEDERQIDWMDLVLRLWVKTDPAKAWAWLEVQSEEVRAGVSPATLEALVESDRAKVEAWLAGSASDHEDGVVLRAWAASFARAFAAEAKSRLDDASTDPSAVSPLDRALFDAVCRQQVARGGLSNLAWIAERLD